MIKRYKPVTASRRGQTKLHMDSKLNSSKSTQRKMSKTLRGPVARSKGRITIHGRRKGADKRSRLVDFKRNKYDIKGKVEAIDYDPTRTANLALILYVDGERRYILAPEHLNVGDVVESGENAELKVGNALPMGKIPLGMSIHNIEMYPKAGGKFIRSAGVAGVLTAKEGKYVNIKMPSGEVRRFLAECYATLGQVSNEDWKLVVFGKAGRSYHMGKRPKTRGKARSDGHPLGGSYARRVGRQPVDKWGNKSKGKHTRNRKHTNKYIVSRRGAK